MINIVNIKFIFVFLKYLLRIQRQALYKVYSANKKKYIILQTNFKLLRKGVLEKGSLV